MSESSRSRMVKNDFSPKRIQFLGRISYVYSNFIGFLLLCCFFLSNKLHARPVTGVIILQAGLKFFCRRKMIYSTVSLMLCDFMSPFPSPWRRVCISSWSRCRLITQTLPLMSPISSHLPPLRQPLVCFIHPGGFFFPPVHLLDNAQCIFSPLYLQQWIRIVRIT